MQSEKGSEFDKEGQGTPEGTLLTKLNKCGEKKRGQATFWGVWQGQEDRPSQGVSRVN